MSINSLPYEILSQIFENPCLDEEDLSNILKVSRRWEKVVQPLAYKKLTIKDGTESNWRPTDSDFNHFLNYLENYQFVKSLTIELSTSGFQLRDLLVLARISRCFPEVTSYQIYDRRSGLGWILFWLLLDLAIFSAPKLTSLSIYRSIVESYEEGNSPDDLPEINYFPGRLQNLKEVTVFISVNIGDTSVIIDGFFRSLLKILGKGSEQLIFNVKFLGSSDTPYTDWIWKEKASVASRGWELRNLRRLSFEDTWIDNSLAMGLISADYSKVEYLTMTLEAWEDFCYQFGQQRKILGIDIILFPNVKILRLKNREEYPESSIKLEEGSLEVSGKWGYNVAPLKYFPMLRYIRISKRSHHMEFPICVNPHGMASIEPGYQIEHVREFFPGFFSSLKSKIRKILPYEYEDLEKNWDPNDWNPSNF